MAATLSTHFSRDEVLEHDIYNPAPTASSESFEDREKNALSLLFQDSRENEDRKRLFVDAAWGAASTNIVQPLTYAMHRNPK
jgi:hypothetical protein